VHLPAAGSEQQQVRELLVHRVARLVDDADDREAALAQLAEALRQLRRRGAVEARRGLVHEADGRHRHELHADVDALLLAAAHAAPRRVSDEAVADVIDAQDLERVHDVAHLQGVGG